MKTRWTLALLPAALLLLLMTGLPSAAYGNLVANGGFETGDLTGWTAEPGNCGVDTSGAYSHSGSDAATLGYYGMDRLLYQSVPTIAGQQYEITYWLRNVSDANGNVYNNDFYAAWGGAEILASAIVNAGVFGYTQYDYVVTGGDGATLLSFGSRQDAKFFALDDVSVVPSPEPATLSLLALGGLLALANRRRGRKA